MERSTWLMVSMSATGEPALGSSRCTRALSEEVMKEAVRSWPETSATR